MKHTIEFDQKCKSCKGTGLYVGMGERDGAAVVCHRCDGTGKYHFKHEYEDFDGRLKRENIKRVYAANVGRNCNPQTARLASISAEFSVTSAETEAKAAVIL